MGPWLLLGFWLAAGGDGIVWTPPAKPDPQAILQEAMADTQAGRHALALAKHEWFHREALKVEPSFYGVRLSFALGNWVELGRSYPPALESLKRFREEALQQVLSSKGGFAEFSDFVAMNGALGENARTRDAFLKLHKENPEVAKRLYNLAEPALIEAQEYAICGRYIDADEDWARIAFTHATGNRIGQEETFGPEHKRFMEQSFTHQTALLIALLVLNERTSDADRIARKARLEWDAPAFQQAIDGALKGEIPPPFP